MGVDCKWTPEKLISDLLGAQSFLNKFYDPKIRMRRNKA